MENLIQVNKDLASQDLAGIVTSLVLEGDLSKMNKEQQVQYYNHLCKSLGLNPLTQPFAILKLDNKLVMYAKKDCTDQLRKVYSISVIDMEASNLGEVYLVKVKVKDKDGRMDVGTGLVPLKKEKKGQWINGQNGGKGYYQKTGDYEQLTPEDLCNAIMKAECVPTSYQILTENGWKYYDQLSTGETVAAYDNELGQIVWTSLIEASCFKNKAINKYESSVFSFEFTSGHKWETLSQGKNYKGLVEFEEIGENNRILLSAPCKTKVNSVLDEKEAAILGLILTDGSIKYYKNRIYRCYICQSKEENFDYINDLVREIATHSVTDNREHGWKDQHIWYLNVPQTQTIFQKAGIGSLDDLQQLPARLSFEAREKMIEAMMIADGDKRQNFGKGDSRIVDLFEILNTLNGRALSKTKVRIFKNSTKPFYQKRILSFTSVVRKYLELTETRIGDVWCPTTKYGNWVCKTDEGFISITGNTKAKRRATLSICGLGMLDESELDTVKGWAPAPMPQEEPIGIETKTPKPVDAKPASDKQKDLVMSLQASHHVPEEVKQEVWGSVDHYSMTEAKDMIDKLQAYIIEGKKQEAAAKAAVSNPEAKPAEMAPGVHDASAKQKEEIIRLLNNPVITRQEKTKMLLNINRLDEKRAAQSIEKLKAVVKEREEGQAAAA